MKLTHVLEADVVDLGARREQKAQSRAEQRKKDRSNTLSDLLDDLNVVVDSTIEQLQTAGMSEGEATKAVMSHLSDVVMAHDIS